MYHSRGTAKKNAHQGGFNFDTHKFIEDILDFVDILLAFGLFVLVKDERIFLIIRCFMYLLDKSWVVFSPMIESRKIAHGRITG